jgi:microcystin-dependent protein
MFTWEVRLPVPEDPPDTGVFFYPAFNAAWLPVIIGKLLELRDPLLCEDPPDDITAQVDELIARLEVDNSAMTRPEIGEIRMFGFDTAPSGWLPCNGDTISRTTYADLFAAIGTAFGSGNGTTTFGIPSFIHRMPYGAANGGGDVGGFGGAATHVLQVSEIPSHTHPPLSPATVFRGSHAGGSSGYGTANQSQTVDQITTTGATGGGGAHNNLPPYMTVLICIYTGVL